MGMRKGSARALPYGASMVALALGQTAPAASPAPGMTQTEDQVLESVLIEGNRPIRDQKVVLEWMERLADKFRVTGTVTLHREEGDRTLDMSGQADCVAMRLQFAPAVHCDLLMSRSDFGEQLPGPEDASIRAPSVIMFGYAFEDFGIRHQLVQSGGNAEAGTGFLISPNLMLSRAPCLNTPAPCERILRITARPDLTDVKMEIEFESAGRKVLTQTLLMHRDPRGND